MAVAGVATAWAGIPLDHLRSARRPAFREGHTLLPLTRWGWGLSFEANVELAEHWGYALELGEANARLAASLDDPESRAAKLCALTARDPVRYPLSALVYRAPLDKAFRESLPEEVWCHEADGALPDGKRVWSPLAPETVFAAAGRAAAEPLARVRATCPVAMLLNGGEYALSVEGHHRAVWERDPAVTAAKGERDWFSFISACKARQELPISETVRRAVPDRRLYIYYHTSGCPQRNQYEGWDRWAWDYADMRPISDLPNSSIYYLHFNSGWTGATDMLTQTLNTTGRNIALGQPLSYNWLNGGWDREKLGERALSPLDLYMGYLKCTYTAGMIGGVAGYFAYPKGGFDADTGDEVPHWLAQIMILAHAQALFSHHEDLLRQGNLLPGPSAHRWSADQPAYEFPVTRPGCRVVARRHRGRPEWLLCAWQMEGEEGPAAIELPEAGTVEVQARRCGSVYRIRLIDGTPRAQWLDRNGMAPTAQE
ncbi:MAG: hypothetical protein JXR77_19685 [Lentisphaeria bacterium]|nr:hypothetical protein [Lentisphaeria bacterium]